MKRKRNPWVAFLVFSLGLAALTLACREKEAPLPPDTRAEDERALRDSDAQWSKAADAKDVERFVSFFADDSSDRKSTRLNSSHGYISYAVFCLKKKKQRVAGEHRAILAPLPSFA